MYRKAGGKPNVAIVAFTVDSDVFGWYFSVVVTEQGKWLDDPNMFISFESHVRRMTPQRFVVKKELKEKTYVSFQKTTAMGLSCWGCMAGSSSGTRS